MKLEHGLTFALGLLFYLLFYEENPGINLLLWSAAMGGVALWRHPGLLQSATGRWALLLFAGANAAFMWVGSQLALLSVLAGYGLLVGAAEQAGLADVVGAARRALRRAAYAVLPWVLEAAAQVLVSLQLARLAGQGRVARALGYAGALALVGLFVLLLSGASPLFAQRVGWVLTDVLEWLGRVLDVGAWVSFGVVMAVGTLAAAALLAPARVSDAPVAATPAAPEPALAARAHTLGFFLLVINAVMLAYNALDVHWIWVDFYLPPGMAMAQLVHEGTYLLIASIVLAMATLLIGFGPGYRALMARPALRAGALLWIVQNVVVLVSVGIRNARYIDAHGLAYKRIGVLFFLALALVGLVTLAIYLLRQRPLAYLWRVNGLAAALLWLGAAFVDWDGLILSHNLRRLRPEQLDVAFHYHLSDHQLPVLRAHSRRFDPAGAHDAWLRRRIARYLTDTEQVSWLSWHPRTAQTYHLLKTTGATSGPGTLGPNLDSLPESAADARP